MPLDALKHITAQLTDVSFYDADSSYTIARAATAENDNITLVGYLKGGIPGEVIDAAGYWRYDDKNEARFYIENFTKNLPVTENGIALYLHSGIIADLSPKQVEAIVKHCGLQTFDVLANRPQELAAISNIGPATAAALNKSWHKHKAISDLTDFLHKVSVSPAFAAPIYNKLGPRAQELIQANPFILVPQIKSLSFVTAAFIARQLNLEYTDAEAVKSGLFAVLENLAVKGHVYYPYTKLLNNAVKKLGLKPEPVANAIAAAAAAGQIVIKDLNLNDGHFVYNNKAVYLKANYDYEHNFAQALKQHLQAPLNAKLQTQTLKDAIDNLPKTGDAMKQYLKTLVSHKCCLIDECAKKYKFDLMRTLEHLAATNVINITIVNNNPIPLQRKKLAKSPHVRELLAAHNTQNRLICDMLVVSQASLLSYKNMHDLIQILPSGAALVLVGDSNHLPPKGPGRIFHDLLFSKAVPVLNLSDLDVELTHLNRAACAFANGDMPEMPEFKPFELKEQNLYFIEQDKPEKIIKTIGGLYAKRLPRALNVTLADIQVICLSSKGPLGAKKLNVLLQERLNKRNGGLKYNGFIYHTNDKIMQACDNYAKNIYFGQTGIIKAIDMHKKEICADFYGKTVKYAFYELDEIKPAYAVAINKTGLNLHKFVILPLHGNAYMNLNRATLYTAFASAANTLIIVGQKRALKIALGNYKVKQRYTGLKELLLT